MTIQEIKERVGQAAENIIAQGMGLEKHGTKYKCPNTFSHNNGDKNPSLSWDKKALQFYCFACNTKIDLYGFYTNFKNMSHEEVITMYDSPGESYKIEIKEKPNFKLDELKDFQLDYLKSTRGLSQEAIKHFQLGNVEGNIGIPYLVNEEITGIKLKNMKGEKPKYLSVTGSEFGLLNKDNLNFEEPLVIVEGEMDCMSVFEANYKNVVSVGTGGSSLDKLIKSEGDFLKKFKALIVFSDMDDVGKAMRKRFLDEFSYLVKFPNPEYYLGCKDANEILLQHGKEKVLKVIHSASLKIEGMINLNDGEYTGIDEMPGNYVPTGIASIDYAINDLSPSMLSLITGRSNGGKSTFVSQIITNAIDKGFKVFLIAGEGITSMLISNIYKNVIGGNSRYYDTKQINKRSFKMPKPFVVKALKKWHADRLTIFSKGESKLKGTDELLKMMATEIKVNHPDLVIVDNLMSAISIEKASEKWERQADFIQNLCDLAKSENTHISIVLHPNKTVRKNASMDFEDISGSSDIYNKADVILTVKRIYDEDRDHDGEIEVLKNRYFNDLPCAQTVFDEETGMLLELRPDGEPYNYNLQWEKFIDIDDLINNPGGDVHQKEKVEKPAFKIDYSKARTEKSVKPKSKSKIDPKQIELVQIN